MDVFDPQVFERVWRGDAEGQAFHAPALAPVLRPVDATRAARRPLPGQHSIHEIAEHMCAWREYVLSRLDGGPIVDLPDDGWVRIESADPGAWARLCARLTTTEDRILALARTREAPEKVRLAVLRFVLHHDLHHGGQIAMLAHPV